MRILVIGDSHAEFPYVRSMLNVAEEQGADLVYVVGDFGYWAHTARGVDFLNDVDAEAGRLSIPVFFCDGNHESFDMLYSIPVADDGFRYVMDNIIHTPRGHIWEWDGKMFMAMGGAHSIDGPGGAWHQARGPGNGWWPQETIKDEEVEGALQNIDMLEAQGRSIDVLFAHDVPIEVNIPGIEGYPLGDLNRKQLSRVVWGAEPSLIVSGHYHRFHRSIAAFPYHQSQQIILNCNGASGCYMTIDTDPFGIDIPEVSATPANKFNSPRVL